MKILGIEISEESRVASPNQLEFSFYCPGCGNHHGFRTSPGGPQWTWNQDYDKPTISPSILVQGCGVGGRPDSKGRCHMFVRDGKIQYLSDCTHKLAGQTVDMEDA